MSRWLRSLDQVSSLIEKLDGRVANAAEERNGNDETEDLSGIGEILSKRGLSDNESDDGDVDIETNHESAPENLDAKDDQPLLSESPDPNQDELDQLDHYGTSAEKDSPLDGDSQENPEKKIDSEQHTSLEPSLVPRSEVPTPESTRQEQATPNPKVVAEKLPTTTLQQRVSKPKEEREPIVASKENQKEVRTLRKHVLRLNSTLEDAENEIAALREELAQAAQRIDKGRAHAKGQREALEKQKKEEMKALQEIKESELAEQKAKFESLIATFKETSAEQEINQKEEMDNWNREFLQAAEREQEMTTRVNMLMEEKSVLLDQISTMRNQQAALASRVESLSQASDAAEARERDTEERLDTLLTQHARQISQRQAREVELERTVQELNMALVAASGTKHDDQVPRHDNRLPSANVEALEIELESAQSQLRQEKERVEILYQQLKEMSKESSQEASSVHALEVQYQRQVADLTVEVSRLHAALRNARKEKRSEQDKSKPPNDFVVPQQVQLLSDEILKLQDKLAQSSGELTTLKSRVKAANERANKAEDELAAATLDGLERASSTSVGGISRRKLVDGGGSSATIRAAMKLNHGQGDRTEQIGKVVDAVDAFAATTGKYLRRNPLARAGFILYLVMVHMWTFLLLFFHAHYFETNRAEFGSNLAVGPDSLLEQHKDIMGQVAAVIQSSQQETSP